jgi:hypothetical protein
LFLDYAHIDAKGRERDKIPHSQQREDDVY